MNKILLNLLLASVIFLIGIIIYSVFQFMDIQKIRFTNEARFQCANSSKYEVTKDDTVVSYPIADLYEKCLKEAGVN